MAPAWMNRGWTLGNFSEDMGEMAPWIMETMHGAYILHQQNREGAHAPLTSC